MESIEFKFKDNDDESDFNRITSQIKRRKVCYTFSVIKPKRIIAKLKKLQRPISKETFEIKLDYLKTFVKSIKGMRSEVVPLNQLDLLRQLKTFRSKNKLYLRKGVGSRLKINFNVLETVLEERDH